MPLYEYRCGACSKVFESYMRPSEEGKHATCPACGGASEKVGISLFRAAGSGEHSKPGGSSCGGGFRRSPFG